MHRCQLPRVHFSSRVGASRLQVQNAISRQRKEETVQQLETLLQGSAVVVGLRYQGLTVKQLQEFRRSLPAESKVLVCKNTLMRVACDKVEGWSELKPATKGDNAWLFVNEEVIAESIKAYVAFEKKLLEGVPKEERATARPIDVRCGGKGTCGTGTRLAPAPSCKQLQCGRRGSLDSLAAQQTAKGVAPCEFLALCPRFTPSLRCVAPISCAQRRLHGWPAAGLRGCEEA